MSKVQKLFDLIAYVNIKRQFTASDVARDFGISVRTAHRYLLELDGMGVPLYTEQGKNGGYRLLSESPLVLGHRRREREVPFLKSLLKKSIQKIPFKIKYQSEKGISDRTICPIGIYSNDGIWYLPAYDYTKQGIRLFRADRVIGVEDADGDFETIPTTLADILHDYKVKDPVRLYVELSEKGIICCKDNPYFETNVKHKENSVGGYIDTVIDRSDLEFASRFFMSLSEDAKVIEPIEMKEYILLFAKKILEQWRVQ